MSIQTPLGVGRGGSAAETSFEIRMETDFSEWTTEIDAESDVNWSAAAGLAGSAGGMAVTVDNATVAYLVKTVPASTTGDVRARFYIKPNSLPMDNAEEVRVLFLICDVNASPSVVAIVALLYDSGYKIKTSTFTDLGGVLTTTPIVITDAEHWVEIWVQRATSAVASDGRLDIWVDDADQQSLVNYDNYDFFTNFSLVRMGQTSVLGTPGPGDIYLDELVVNYDGSYIGPL